MSIIGWKGYKAYSSLRALIPSGDQVAKIFDEPIINEEHYSPDSTMKLGVYRFIVPGEGGFKITDRFISLVDTSMEYPKKGNIITMKDSIPEIKWESMDSILIELEYPFSKKINGITVVSSSVND
ncbi:MAG: hypothetical protein BalsKO_00040 [Balneolaceae bacterium]